MTVLFLYDIQQKLDIS